MPVFALCIHGMPQETYFAMTELPINHLGLPVFVSSEPLAGRCPPPQLQEVAERNGGADLGLVRRDLATLWGQPSWKLLAGN